MHLTLEQTPRGQTRGTFADFYGSRCAIQDATHGPPMIGEEHLWLGAEVDSLGIPSCRMCLTREMAATLLPYIAAFVATGRMPNRDLTPSVTEHVGGKTYPAQHVHAAIMDEYVRWVGDDTHEEAGDALEADRLNAIRLGAIGSLSNVLGNICYPAVVEKPLVQSRM